MGLRNITTEALKSMLEQAKCVIVEVVKNEYVDSYLLSESSLFVYPTSFVVKTCGKTTPLSLLQPWLSTAEGFKLNPVGVRYTRGEYKFPELQDKVHSDFTNEIELISGLLGYLGQKCTHVGKKWNYFSCGQVRTELCVEVALTGLSPKKASIFSKKKFQTGADMTHASGIQEILPGAKILDHAFPPNGYSMNALECSKISTIHVTPEEAFNYASFECSGYDLPTVLKELIPKVLACLEPEQVSIAIYGCVDEISLKEQFQNYKNFNISSLPLEGNEGSLVLVNFKA